MQINSVNPGEHVPLIPDAVQGMMIGISMGSFAVPMDELSKTFHVQLTPPETVIQNMLAGS